MRSPSEQCAAPSRPRGFWRIEDRRVMVVEGGGDKQVSNGRLL
jgi:hypothetical protein